MFILKEFNSSIDTFGTSNDIYEKVWNFPTSLTFKGQNIRFPNINVVF